jgi:hypothetical protein
MAGPYRSPGREDVSAEVVRYLFDYDPLTGILRWRNPPRQHAQKKGAIAGQMHRGRRVIFFYYKQFEASNIAWLHFYGEWPKFEVDHRNRDPSDDSIANLRDVTTAVNCQNKGKSKTNTSGFRGVNKHRPTGKWHARIKVNMTRYHLGEYSTPELAAGAYRIAAAALHWEA